jgi:soluble lytic murein transglycosylase-like protein
MRGTEFHPSQSYWLPPLVVVAISIVMAALLSQVEIGLSAPVSAITDQAASMAAVPPGAIAPLFTPEVQYWQADIRRWSQEWGLDPNLIATVMQIESCGYRLARSSAGAMGLFQVMPLHFADGEDPYDPNINAYRGMAHLRASLEARGNQPRYGLAGYNAGISGANRAESAWPAETIRYVYWGTGIYADAQAGQASSQRLDEWLGHGGASLCAQAAQQLGLTP